VGGTVRRPDYKAKGTMNIYFAGLLPTEKECDGCIYDEASRWTTPCSRCRRGPGATTRYPDLYETLIDDPDPEEFDHDRRRHRDLG